LKGVVVVTREIVVICAGLPSGYSISQILDESTGNILSFVLYKDGVEIGSFLSVDAAAKSAVEDQNKPPSSKPRMK